MGKASAPVERAAGTVIVIAVVIVISSAIITAAIVPSTPVIAVIAGIIVVTRTHIDPDIGPARASGQKKRRGQQKSKSQFRAYRVHEAIYAARSYAISGKALNGARSRQLPP
jgi:hypothetical protein